MTDTNKIEKQQSLFDTADTFNKYLVIIVPNRKISPKETFEINVDETNNLTLKAIIKIKYYLNPKMIKSKRKILRNQKLRCQKISQLTNIPTKVIYKNSNYFSNFLHHSILLP